MEANSDITVQEINPVKKYYALLEIKDYQLRQEIGQRCGIESPTILYFYNDNCTDCRKQGFVLSKIKSIYPDIRIYSFDRDIDGLDAIKTMEQIFKIDQTVTDTPILVMDKHVVYGLQEVQDITDRLPYLEILEKEYAIHDEIRSWAKDHFGNNASNFEIKKVEDDKKIEESETESTYEIKYKLGTGWLTTSKVLIAQVSYKTTDEGSEITEIINETEE